MNGMFVFFLQFGLQIVRATGTNLRLKKKTSHEYEDLKKEIAEEILRRGGKIYGILSCFFPLINIVKNKTLSRINLRLCLTGPSNHESDTVGEDQEEDYFCYVCGAEDPPEVRQRKIFWVGGSSK